MNRIKILVIYKMIGQAIVEGNKVESLSLLRSLIDEIFVEEPEAKQQGK